MHGGGESGVGLIDLLIALAVLALLLGLAAGGLGAGVRTRASEMAARHLALEIRRTSLAAVLDGADRGLIFPPLESGDEPLCWAVDGDGDGVRRQDIEDAIDPCSPSFSLARETPQARIGRPDWPRIRKLPPARGWMGSEERSVRFGRSRILTLSAEGTATPGSVFITDGKESLCAVVVSGPSARVRIWCFHRPSEEWIAR